MKALRILSCVQTNYLIAALDDGTYRFCAPGSKHPLVGPQLHRGWVERGLETKDSYGHPTIERVACESPLLRILNDQLSK